MTGKDYIDNLFYDIGKYQVLTTDTNLRVIALSWCNRVLKDISGRQRHWTWLEKTSTFSTVASQMTYDLPTDIDLSGRKIFTLKQYTTPCKLIYIDQKRFDEIEADPTNSSGDPEFYTIWANGLRLWPVPSQVITMYLRYMKTITAVTDSAVSTTDIPGKFDDVVLDGMKKLAYNLFPEWGNAGQQAVIYENGIKRMEDDNKEILDMEQDTEAHGYTQLREDYPFNNRTVGT